jgi:hypothetical protein
MRGGEAVLRLGLAHPEAWARLFPGLHHRTHFTLASHLCAETQRRAATFSRLHGLARQVSGIDESTLKSRIVELANAGLCALAPPGDAIRASTTVLATARLVDTFDQYLLAVLPFVAALVTAPPFAIARFTMEQRAAALKLVLLHGLHCDAALDRYFVDRTMSAARLEQALQRLRSFSHSTLLLLAAMRHAETVAARADPHQAGLAADAMALRLYALFTQGTDTTRTHLGHLLDLGLLERRRDPGGSRALFLGLSPNFAPYLEAALTAAAAAAPTLVSSLLQPADTAPIRGNEG